MGLRTYITCTVLEIGPALKSGNKEASARLYVLKINKTIDYIKGDCSESLFPQWAFD